MNCREDTNHAALPEHSQHAAGIQNARSTGPNTAYTALPHDFVDESSSVEPVLPMAGTGKSREKDGNRNDEGTDGSGEDCAGDGTVGTYEFNFL